MFISALLEAAVTALFIGTAVAIGTLIMLCLFVIDEKRSRTCCNRCDFKKTRGTHE